MKKVSSLEILKLIEAKNQEKAISMIFKNFFPLIKSHLLKKGAIREDIDDLFQDALFIFYKKAREKELKEDTDIGSYLYTVTKNLWLNKVKRDSKSTELQPENWDSSIESSPYKDLVDEERRENIMSIFTKLGARCEELMLSRFYYSLSMKEIVENMGFKNENSVKTQSYKCKQQLLELAKENPWFVNLLRSGN